MVIVRTRSSVHTSDTCIHYVSTDYNGCSFFQRPDLSRRKSRTRRAIAPGQRGYRNPIIDRSSAIKKKKKKKKKSTAKNISWNVYSNLFLSRKHTRAITNTRIRMYIRFIPTRAIRRCKFLEYTLLVLIPGEAFPRTDVARPVYETVLSLIVGEAGVLL